MLLVKYLIAVAVFFSVTKSFSQLTIGQYKALTDQSVKSASLEVFRKSKCDGFLGQLTNNAEMIAGNCDSSKEKIFPIKFISIGYTFYSKQLDYEFSFSIGIDSALNLYTDEGVEDKIPECLRLNRKCNYVSKRKAIELARKDSIGFRDNLIAELIKGETSSDFFWVVSGQDKRDIDFSMNPKTGWQNLPKRPKNTRYINASTGMLVTYSNFKIGQVR